LSLPPTSLIFPLHTASGFIIPSVAEKITKYNR
jgi:hypothetical protein